MKNNKLIGAGLLSLLLVAGVAISASAYQGDYTKKGPDYSPERHETMTTAFENDDYETWKSQMEDKGRVTQVVNETNFAQFAEANKLASEGKYAEADAIRAGLGLRTSNGERTGHGYKRGNSAGKGGCAGQCGGQGNRGGSFVDSNGDGVCDNMN